MILGALALMRAWIAQRPRIVYWASVVAIIGYAVGEALTRVLGDLKRIEEWVFGAILVGGLALIGWLRRRGRRAAAAAVGRP